MAVRSVQCASLIVAFDNLRMSPPPSSLGGLSPSLEFGLFFACAGARPSDAAYGDAVPVQPRAAQLVGRVAKAAVEPFRAHLARAENAFDGYCQIPL